MNDNEVGFRIRIALYVQKYKGIEPRFHYLTDLLTKSGISWNEARQTQIVIEKIGQTPNIISFKNTGKGHHYLEDIELGTLGIEKVDNLVDNTISDPSPLKLTIEEKEEWNEIVNEGDRVEKVKKFNDFILNKKHHFFETAVF